MLDQLQDWWQNTIVESPTALGDAGVVLLALLGGYVIGGMVARGLRAKNFDAALRLPGASRGSEEEGMTPTVVAGLLVRLTIWAGAAWWLAEEHGRSDLARTLRVIIDRTWAFAVMLAAALALGSLVARRLIDCVHGLPSGTPGAKPSANGTAAAAGNALAGVAGAGAYLLVVLLAVLTAADLFDWPLTRTSALALWQFAQRLSLAAGGLFIGYLGARWTRDLTVAESAGSPGKLAGQYTALAIMAATSVLAVTVLLSNQAVLLGLAALAALGFLIWVMRGYLPDITAGLHLRQRAIHEVLVDGDRWQVVTVGLLSSQLSRAGEFCRLQNRQVLKARVEGAALAEAGHR